MKAFFPRYLTSFPRTLGDEGDLGPGTACLSPDTHSVTEVELGSE